MTLRARSVKRSKLLGVLVLRGDQLPRGVAAWKHLAVAALLTNVLPYSLFAYGEQHVTSVLAGIWNATTPLLTLVVVMVALTEERPTRQRTLGMGIGFAGVLVVLGPWTGIGGSTL